ncbi:roadblock/LC7 domain-containing protein [Haloechinothrix halophila]|uniref:roadblock/LC7 domain-containing protein n=1 Tax=Haloechinothrix halophila TaxID=1069073 RepID=UPI000404A138|nr:roadblock/LC7 domain-containing protein [Haloechinothrix halophila]
MASSAGRPTGTIDSLLTDFAQRVDGVAHAVIVGYDGLPLAASAELPRDQAEQLAVIASGLMYMAGNAAKCFTGGAVNQTVVEMERGYLYLMSVHDGAVVAALASPRSELATVAYEIAVLTDSLVDRVPRASQQARGDKGAR